jgi:hypothetical protein
MVARERRPLEERTREAGPPRHPSRVAREKSRDDYIALQDVFPSFTSHSTLAPTFQPSPLTWCSLPSSIFTVAMPLSSILSIPHSLLWGYRLKGRV